MIHILTAVEQVGQQLSSVQKHILMTLANFCDENGEVVLSSKKICNSVCCSRATFFRHLKTLEEEKWIAREIRVRENNSRVCSLYMINLAKIDETVKSKLMTKISSQAAKKIMTTFEFTSRDESIKMVISKEKLSTDLSTGVSNRDGGGLRLRRHIYIFNNTSIDNKHGTSSIRHNPSCFDYEQPRLKHKKPSYPKLDFFKFEEEKNPVGMPDALKNLIDAMLPRKSQSRRA